MILNISQFKKSRLAEAPTVWTSKTGARVEYLAFADEGVRNKTPLILLGGAFQNFRSFRKEAELFSADRPVLLLDLPSQGSNRQLLPDAEFQDLGNLLGEFFIAHEVKQVIPVGLSYGSAIAFHFARLYPQLVEKLILGGATPKLRSSFETLLHETFRALDLGQRERFAHGVVVNLINYSKRASTGISDRYLTAFQEELLNMDDLAFVCYRQNCQRIFRAERLTARIECPALVFTGEHDHFTLPQENAELVQQSLPNGTFVLVKDGDHLLNLERRDTVLALYQAFLTDSSLGQIPGVTIPELESFIKTDRRQITRVQTPGLKASLNETVTVELEDLSLLGCRLTGAEAVPASFFDARVLDLQINLPGIPALTAHWADEDSKTRLLFSMSGARDMAALEKSILTLARS
ncbi:alpha/beta fold hydrolase [Bdellovibrio sp. HCB337]|uniref:alpha/beta fold hydrolase n=1 Tax=Bdellovibrio sp. HCB337 TaxID=3394358 RepID=UPI0039A4A18F